MARKLGRGNTPLRIQKMLEDAVKKKSQNVIARELGIGVAAVNRYLKGIGEPTTETLKKFSDYFDVSIAELQGVIVVPDGVTFPPGTNLHDKIVYLNMLECSDLMERITSPTAEDIQTFNYFYKQAKTLLEIPRQLQINLNDYEMMLSELAKKIADKYEQMLRDAEPEIKALLIDNFLFSDKLHTSGSGFYDLVITPDYFTKLTATFDSILSLSLRSKQAQQNNMFLAVAVSLAKLLRDMPEELLDIYDTQYMFDLKKLAGNVIDKFNSEHLMERWTPPSIKPKLKQPMKQSDQDHKQQRNTPKKKAKP